MRRIGILVSVLLVFTLCGCAPKSEEPAMLDLLTGEVVAQQSASPEDAAQQQPNAALKVADTAAWVFVSGDTSALYGAAVYENTGNVPLVVTGAEFAFSGAAERTETFVPPLARYDVLLPGETGYAAAWFDGAGLEANAELSLEARLQCAPSDATPLPLTAEELFIADNYPAFTTVTGTLRNDSARGCGMNMIYLALYDAEDTFLGAWYFSKNAQLESGDAVRFTTHLKAFPLPALAERTAQIKTRAFGFDPYSTDTATP